MIVKCQLATLLHSPFGCTHTYTQLHTHTNTQQKVHWKCGTQYGVISLAVAQDVPIKKPREREIEREKEHESANLILGQRLRVSKLWLFID